MRLRGNRGISLIEVMIAVVILGVGGSLLAHVSIQSSKTQSTAKLRERQARIAQGIYQRLQSDLRWSKVALPAPNDCSQTCNPLKFPMATATSVGLLDVVNASNVVIDKSLLEGIDGSDVRYIAQVVAKPSFSTAHYPVAPSVGSDVPPDAFTLVVTVYVDPTSAVGARLGTQVTPTVVGGTTTSRQTAQTGTAEVQVCKLGPLGQAQLDERFVINECANQGALKKHFLWIEAPTVCNIDCPARIAAAEDGHSWTNVDQVSGISVTVGNPTSSQYPHGPQTGTTDANGNVTLPLIDPGLAKLTIAAPVGYKLWTSHSVPTSGWATIQAGQTSQIKLIFVPKAPPSYKLRVQTLDVTHPFKYVTVNKAMSDFSFKMIAAPYARVQLALNWTYVKKNAVSATVNSTELETGIYSPQVVLGPATQRMMKIYPTLTATTPVKYLWLNHNWTTNLDASSPASGVGVLRYNYCLPSKRTSIVKVYCEGASQCWYTKTDGSRVYLGPCTTTDVAGAGGNGGT